MPAPHAPSHVPPPAVAERHLRLVVLALLAATVIGGIVLWPRGAGPDPINAEGLYEVDATVDRVEIGPCPSVEVQTANSGCQLVDLTVTSGITKGERAYLEARDIDFAIPKLAAGDKLVLRYAPSAPEPYQYYFFDFQRETPMVALAAMFVLVVVLIGRALGARALVGLVVSLGVILWFVLPSLLRANNALGVALVGTVAIAFIALYLAHGFTPATTVGW